MRVRIRFLSWLPLIMLLFCNVSAATVTSKDVSAVAGEKIQIPVCITQNEGIMGFRISVQYPSDLLCQPNVKYGSLTNTGILDSNTSQEGSIDVLWCSSSDVSGDGSLFILEFLVHEGTQGKQAELVLSYEQEDTFNELWDNVVLQLSPICVIIQNDTLTETNTQASDSATENDTQPASESIEETDTQPATESTAATTEVSEVADTQPIPESTTQETSFSNRAEDAVSDSSPQETVTMEPDGTGKASVTGELDTQKNGQNTPLTKTEMKSLLIVLLVCLAAAVVLGSVLMILKKRGK